MNMSDEEMDKMIEGLAKALVARIYGEDFEPNKNTTSTEGNDELWHAERDDDHCIGELARLMTLSNIYEQREEYENCAKIKVMIDKLTEIVEKL